MAQTDVHKCILIYEPEFGPRFLRSPNGRGSMGGHAGAVDQMWINVKFLQWPCPG